MANPPRDRKAQEERAVLMMDEPKRPLPQPVMNQQAPQQPQPKAEPKQKKEEKPKMHWSDYTLMPGRKGIDQQKIDDPANLQNLPTPKNQSLEPKATQEQNKQTEKKDTAKSKQPSIEQAEVKATEKLIQKEKIEKPTMFQDQGAPSAVSKQKASEEQPFIPAKQRTPIEDQNPYDYVPSPKRTISFKDINLGFDHAQQTIGNNANLIQQGKSFETPDAVSLKHLTYYNQCAGMMRTAFATHPQARLRPYPTNKRFLFTVTVDRQGNQIGFRVVTGSGDQMLDKIISESVQSVTLFPQVPNFIEDNPFVMRWTFLH